MVHLLTPWLLDAQGGPQAPIDIHSSFSVAEVSDPPTAGVYLRNQVP